MASQIYRCIRKCAWYPTPMHKGQPTSPLHVYDPDDDFVPMGRDLPMSMERFDPDDPWVQASGILKHFMLPQEVDPEMIETPEQYMARCQKGVRAPVDPDMLAKVSKLPVNQNQQGMMGKPKHIDSTKQDMYEQEEAGRRPKTN